MRLGPIRFSVAPRSAAAQRPFAHKLVVRETKFRAATQDGDDAPDIQALYSQLANDPTRNELIVGDVISAIEAGRSPILLTERRDHLECLAERLRPFVRHMIALHGALRPKKRRQLAEQLAEIPESHERLLLATGRHIGEGFDDPRLDTLFLAMPVSWKGTLTQYAGRLHRQHSSKREVRIVDYVDSDVPVLRRMFEKRLSAYRAIEYARTEAPLGYAPSDETVIELDEP